MNEATAEHLGLRYIKFFLPYEGSARLSHPCEGPVRITVQLEGRRGNEARYGVSISRESPSGYFRAFLGGFQVAGIMKYGF